MLPCYTNSLISSCIVSKHRLFSVTSNFNQRTFNYYINILITGYHLWNADLRSDDNPVEANLGFACRKDGEYIGNEHVTKARANGVTKKYAFFTMEDKVRSFY